MTSLLEARPKLNSLWGTILKALVVSAVSLDIFSFLGARIAPGAVGQVLCAMRPIGVVAKPLFPGNWVAYLEIECHVGTADPAISMISLMLKTSLIIVAALLFYVEVGFRLSRRSVSVVSTKEEWLSKRKACLKDLKIFVLAALVSVPVWIINWMDHVYVPPLHLDTTILGKGLEDVFIVTGVIGIGLALGLLYSAGSLVRLYFVGTEK